ncbi:hypothetical protein K458DRAFT_436768 [Lentithecium fluviatile CBS 122367]|uniref:Uncharacterized protein n=1 Tax=Lentithecium fluviatile CBS 122367 TaxID=1168545 RepID=A0A6G1IH44_9PLEO|nr:hypothetical protein K458DRAFT_436768 [Lentithecium fluviatile CBS 122367]
MLAGLFASVSAVLPLNCLFNLSNFKDLRDMPAALWLALTYHFSEMPIGIICCSAPVVAPVVPPVFKHIKNTSLASPIRTLLVVGSEPKTVSLGIEESHGHDAYADSGRPYSTIGSINGSKKAVETDTTVEIPL